MSANTTELLQALQSKTDEDRLAYETLVTRLVGNENVSTEECMNILYRVRKSPADLETDIARGKRIIELQAILAQCDVDDKKFNRFTNEHGDSVKKLEAEIAALQAKLKEQQIAFQSRQMDSIARGQDRAAARRELAGLQAPPPAAAAVPPKPATMAEYHLQQSPEGRMLDFHSAPSGT